MRSGSQTKPGYKSHDHVTMSRDIQCNKLYLFVFLLHEYNKYSEIFSWDFIFVTESPKTENQPTKINSSSR